MSVNVKAAANRVFQEFRTDLIKSKNAAPTLWRSFGMEVPSMSKSSLHAWLANQAAVREWKGPRIAKNMGTRTWEVINRKWELTYGFERDQIDDDLSGLVNGAILEARNQGFKWARHEDLLCAQTLEAGISTECYDGQFFFDTDHPVDLDGITSGTFDNDLQLALTHANFNTAYVSLKSRKNVDGSPRVLGQLELQVPVALGLAADQIVNVDTLTPLAAIGLFGTSGPSKNPLFGKARVLVNPFLSDDARWYLYESDGPIRPILFQRRRALEVAEIGEGSELYFNEEKFEIGGSARYEASYTLPELALTSKP